MGQTKTTHVRHTTPATTAVRAGVKAAAVADAACRVLMAEAAAVAVAEDNGDRRQNPG